MRFSIPIKNQDIRSYRRGPRFLGMFGLIFAIAGIVSLIGSWSNPKDLGGVIVGIVFTIAGFAIYGGRPKTTIHYRRRIIVDRAGAFDLFRRHVYQFDAFSSVVIQKDWHRGDDQRKYQYYGVALQAKDKIRLPLGEYQSFFTARSVAEEIALKFRLPLTDATEGRKYLRSSDILHRSLRDQLIEKGRKISPPTLAHIQHWVIERDHEIFVRLPAAKMSMTRVIEIVSIATSAIIIFYVLLGLIWSFENFTATVFAIGAAVLAVSLPRLYRMSLHLQMEKICFRHHFGPFSWQKCMSANELEELRSIGQGILLLRSDFTQFKIPELTVAESRELTHLIKYWLLNKSQNLKA